MIFVLLLVFFSFSQEVFAEPKLSEYAEQVLNLVKYELPAPSIIGEREWKELQLDRLVTILDRSTTSFGRWGLVQLLHPIADTKELSRRKEIITFLIEHEEDMRTFQEQLKRVKDVEKSLLAYWDKSDSLNRSAERFYFSALGLNQLNNNSIALGASIALEAFNVVKGLLEQFALWGISDEFMRWTLGVQEDFSVWRGAKTGLIEPIMRHSPYLYRVGEGPYTARDAAKATSWGDLYSVWKSGFSVKQFDGTTKDTPGAGSVGAFLMATGMTLFADYQRVNSIDFIAKRLVSMNKDLNDLQKRVSDVAQCVDAIQKLQKIVDKQSPALRSYLGNNDNYENERKNFTENLLAQRFLKKPGYLYSRGHVLTMHLEITQKKKTLIPLLHSVALLDAYCSIAQLYKESQNERVVFSFSEFVEAERPFLDYRDAWLPLLPFAQAVTNDLALGTQNHPGKIIITGPNGGGKSTILKALGVAPVLAQSWCIVPAQKAQQTMFSSIRTALAPREDLEHGLSTFMAEKKTMAELLADIHAAGSDNYMLVLVDEPYKGTVDAESAKRIYQFGKDVAGYSQVLLALATHVKKPIQLAQDAPGIFGNYQVKINEIKLGIFERLFKLEPGPAMWWFDDSDKRSRFVDWISVKGN